MTSATAAIAAYTSGPVEVPPPLAEAAGDLLAAVVDRAVAGGTDEPVAILTGILGGPTDSGGFIGRYPPEWAATLTGIAATAETPDTGVPGLAAAVAPAALAAASTVDSKNTRAALAIGLEVAARLYEAIAEPLRRRGFEPTATCGHLGAVVAAGHLLGLDETAMTNAIGVAATQATGLAAAAGTMAARLQVGKAAGNAVQAALLARDGYTASPAGIEGRRGLGAVLAPGTDLDAAFDDLGRRWLLESLREDR